VTQNNQKTFETHAQHSKFDDDMLELKKDMKSAKLVDWLQKNQQLLWGAVLLLVIGMFAAGLWSEQQKNKQKAAAMMYYQSIALQNKVEQQAMLEQLMRDYGNTGYATLASLRLSVMKDKEKYLRALMVNKKIMPEIRWQATLDLADDFIEHGKKDAAKKLLATHVDASYEQLRYALLASISTGDAKKSALQKALAAPSHDDILKARLKAELDQLP